VCVRICARTKHDSVCVRVCDSCIVHTEYNLIFIHMPYREEVNGCAIFEVVDSAM
jgi:hypothetical protein